MNKILLKSSVVFLGVCLLFVGIAFMKNFFVLGNVVSTNPVQQSQFDNYTFFATSTVQTNFATSTTATSTNINNWIDSNGRVDKGYFVIAGAKVVNFLFQRGGLIEANTGTTTFSVQVTNKPEPSESDWYDYGALKAIATSSTADIYFTRVANTNAGASNTNNHLATSTSLYTMDDLGWYAVRAIVVEGTDGEHSVRATAQY